MPKAASSGWKYVHPWPNGRHYFFLKGRTAKVPLKYNPGEQGFEAEYYTVLAAAMNGTGPKATRRVRQGHIDTHQKSVGDLVVRYYEDNGLEAGTFKRLDPRTQVDRRRYLENLLRTKVEKSDQPDLPFAEWKVDKVTRSHAKALRAALPTNHRVRNRNFNDDLWRDRHMDHMRVVFEWGMEHDVTTANPFSRLTPLNTTETEGWDNWSEGDPAKFYRHWKRGTIQHLALYLLQHSVTRISDVTRLGRSTLKDDGYFHFAEVKLQNRCRKARKIRFTAEMRKLVEDTPDCWDEQGRMRPTFLSLKGRPYKAGTFGKAFARWCDYAGLGADSDGRVPVRAVAPFTYEGKPVQVDDVVEFRLVDFHKGHGAIKPVVRLEPGRTAHGVRHYAGNTAATKGRSDREIATMLGHSSTKHVGRYTKKANAVAMFEKAITGLYDEVGAKPDTTSKVVNLFDFVAGLTGDKRAALRTLLEAA